MPDINLQRGHTAVLIADFYAEMIDTLPHAIDRGVIGKAVAVQAAARNADVMICYCATVCNIVMVFTKHSCCNRN